MITCNAIMPTKAIRPQMPCVSTQSRNFCGSSINLSSGRPTRKQAATRNTAKTMIAAIVRFMRRFSSGVWFLKSNLRTILLKKLLLFGCQAYFSRLTEKYSIKTSTILQQRITVFLILRAAPKTSVSCIQIRADMEFAKLLFLHNVWRIRHKTGSRLHLGERNDVADVGGSGHQHHKPVQAIG